MNSGPIIRWMKRFQGCFTPYIVLAQIDLSMDNCRRILVMERKPTSSGSKPQYVVGGEVFPASLLQLASANAIWLLLLLIPLLLVYVFAKRGLRLPFAVRAVLRTVFVATRAFV